jgi:hypothetical protein
VPFRTYNAVLLDLANAKGNKYRSTEEHVHDERRQTPGLIGSVKKGLNNGQVALECRFARPSQCKSEQIHL